MARYQDAIERAVEKAILRLPTKSGYRHLLITKFGAFKRDLAAEIQKESHIIFVDLAELSRETIYAALCNHQQLRFLSLQDRGIMVIRSILCKSSEVHIEESIKKVFEKVWQFTPEDMRRIIPNGKINECMKRMRDRLVVQSSAPCWDLEENAVYAMWDQLQAPASSEEVRAEKIVIALAYHYGPIV